MYPPPTDPAAPVETEVPPAPAVSAGPVIRLVIHRLQVNRAVVSVELRRDGNGNLDWNTEPLFSTPNRSDLVGQLAVSANPGEGGNIILVGHNYNNGWYDAEGVFVRLQNMQVGDEITLFTENGGEYHYIVGKVKKVPWQKRNLVELEKHQKFLWPTDHEQLTLVTCGGVNLWSWQARIYVVALPSVPPSP
jgi:LPXTG-site transpeptidase (sortase) family protein